MQAAPPPPTPVLVLTQIVTVGGLLLLAVNPDSWEAATVEHQAADESNRLPDLAIPVSVGTDTRYITPRAFVCSAAMRTPDPQHADYEREATLHSTVGEDSVAATAATTPTPTTTNALAAATVQAIPGRLYGTQPRQQQAMFTARIMRPTSWLGAWAAVGPAVGVWDMGGLLQRLRLRVCACLHHAFVQVACVCGCVCACVRARACRCVPVVELILFEV